MKGYPAQIVFVSEEHNFQLNEPLLESILTSNRVKDKKVMILSVAGAFRKGKSFLLDFFIRYLSHDIYNLSQNIQEDDLHHLQLFTEYGRVAMDVSEVKPFQSLLFLIRDWAYPYEADYGYEGGLTILNRRLNVGPV
ncbi:atlastin-2-like [Octopus sinensis]|uniref:Atlastin-2-like n=1 Tax=Octopus sinensis TaxID=2607531 RepID=A0A7E6EI87_9MOLL|nr:atlastin-2-like [Octopus sinensis]